MRSNRAHNETYTDRHWETILLDQTSRRLLIASWFASSIVVMCNPALADPIPILNQNSYCRYMQESSKHLYGTYDNCLSKQQEAYDRLKPTWESIPAQWSYGCTNRRSYVDLEQCFNNMRSVFVQEEQKAKQMLDKPFRY
jgi:hypothetical protein